MRISVPRPGDTRHHDGAAETFDDVLGDRQTEAGAAALGGEVGIEDVQQIGWCDPYAPVGDRDGDAPAAGGGLERDQRCRRVQKDPPDVCRGARYICGM